MWFFSSIILVQGDILYYPRANWKKQLLFCNKGDPENTENIWKQISIE